MKLVTKIVGISCLIFQVQALAVLSPEEVACNTALNKGDTKQALIQAEALLKINDKNENALLCQGRAFYQIGQMENALRSFGAAETSATDFYEKAFASLLAGHAFKQMKQPEKAIASYEKSLAYSMKTPTQGLKFSNHMNIGDVQLIEKHYSQAISEFQQANTLAANDNERGESLEQLATSYFLSKDYPHALETEIKAQIMMEKVGTLDQYAAASINLGRYYYANQQYAQAERTLNKIIEFARKQGGLYYEAKGSYCLAQVKAAQNETEKAKSLVAHAMKIAVDANDAALEAEIKAEVPNLF
jgi:tetratricopeptide (TPR) repeat protein